MANESVENLVLPFLEEYRQNNEVAKIYKVRA